MILSSLRPGSFWIAGQTISALQASHSPTQSQSDSNDHFKLSKQNIDSILTTSFSKYDDILDTDIEGEVEVAIHHLKRNCTGGPNALSPEHLKYSGLIFRNWLCQIYNHICHLERISQCFKHGIVIPAHKGKSRDPLLKKSYRGITLTSVLAKVLELVLMERISPLLEDAGVPQISQTAYKKEVSCQDSIFAIKRQMKSSSVMRETMCTPVSMILPALLTQ